MGGHHMFIQEVLQADTRIMGDRWGQLEGKHTERSVEFEPAV